MQGVWMDDVMEWGETHLAKELANAGMVFYCIVL